MNRTLITVIALTLLSGCSTAIQGGSGQLFELSERHVVYRDLTVPEGAGDVPERQHIRVPDIQP